MSYQEALLELGLNKFFTEKELNERYRVLAAKYHPDPYASEGEETFREYNDKMARINEARSILKNHLRKGPIQEEEKEKIIREFKATWQRDINNLLQKYKDNVEIKNICKLYTNRIQTLQTLEELKLQKEEFNQKIEIAKEKILFKSEKEKFRKELQLVTKYNKTDVYAKLAFFYLEKLNLVFSLEKLKQVEMDYQKELAKTEEEEKKKKFQIAKQTFLNDLNARKEKEKDDSLLNLIALAIEELKKCNLEKEIEELKRKFQERVDKRKKEIRKLLEKKEQLLHYFSDLKRSDKEKEYLSLIEKYSAFVQDEISLETLDKIKKEFDQEFSVLKEEKRKQQKNFTVFKDKVKRVAIFKFYTASKTSSFEQIKKAQELLRKSLSLLQKVNEREMDRIAKIFENINYKNIEEEISKLDLYLSIKEGKITIAKEEDIDRLFQFFNGSEPVLDEEEELSALKKKAKQYLLDSFYTSVTNAPIEEGLSSLDALNEVLSLVFRMSDKELLENWENIVKVRFKDKEETKEAIGNMKPSNKVFIHFQTGEVCTLSDLNGEVLVTPIDPKKGVSIVSFNKAKREFVSLHTFFKNATYIGGGNVREKINPYETMGLLFQQEKTDLYFYKQLLLSFYETEEPYFEFASTRYGYGWELTSENVSLSYLPRNLQETFANREACEEMVQEQIQKQIQENISLDTEKKV